MSAMSLVRRPFRLLLPWALAALVGCGGGSPAASTGGDEPAATSPAETGSPAAGADERGASRELVEAGSGSDAPPAAPLPDPPAQDEPLAQILSTAAHHDFGRVWQGAEVTHEFQFTAGGDTDLVIQDFRPDCGCTVAHLEILHPDGTRSPYELKSPAPAGTKFALAASFDTTNREGSQTKGIKIYANILGGVRELTFRADIQPLLRVEPRVAAVEMTVLESREATFTLSGVSGEPFLVTPLRDGLPDELEVTATPLDPATSDDDGRAQRWSIRAVLHPGMPKGIRSYQLRLKTDIVNESSRLLENGEREPFVAQAMLSAVIAGRVAVEPQNLNFGLVAADDTVARTVTLKSYDPGFELPEPTWEVKPYKEGASEAFAKTLHVTKRRAENGEDWELELLLDGLDPEVPRSFYGRFVIQTGHPSEPTLEVTLSGLRRGN